MIIKYHLNIIEQKIEKVNKDSEKKQFEEMVHKNAENGLCNQLKIRGSVK